MLVMLINVSGQSDNNQVEMKDRIIYTYHSIFGVLRKELIKNIGVKRLKSFLLRYGWEIGRNDAKRELERGVPLEEIMKQGPIYHHLNGYINSIEYEASFSIGNDRSMKIVDGKGTWLGSYEAEEHLKHLPISDSPVCYINIGYLNGFLTTACGQTIMAKEVSCVGMGDGECRWVVKPQEAWEEEMQEELDFYHQTPIVEELEYTFEQLLIQRNDMVRVSDIHKKLTDEVVNGKDLAAIAERIVHESQVPVLISNEKGETMAFSGINDKDMEALEQEMQEVVPCLIHDKNNDVQLFSVTHCTYQQYLIAPIVVKAETVAYCSFFYRVEADIFNENDKYLLERVAHAISLFFLNEKTKFEAYERMKGNFLEQLLSKQYTVRSEILKRGTYVKMDLSLPFRVVTLGYVINDEIDMTDEFSLHEQILDKTLAYFKNIGFSLLIGQREGNIVFLINQGEDTQPVDRIFTAFAQSLSGPFKQCRFKIGMSSEGKNIELAAQYYEEALLALRMTTTKQVVSFDDLGIVGVLIKESNVSTVKTMASHMLGSIYEAASKNNKLIKTLYVFLANGGKLDQTRLDLSLSMSGLLYRINKIESIIKKDLRNPADSYQVFLIIEALIALGELEIEA